MMHLKGPEGRLHHHGSTDLRIYAHMSKGSLPNPTHASERFLRLEPVTVAGSGVPSAGLLGGGRHA